MGDRVRLCARQDVEPGTSRRFDLAGRPVALVRIGEEFYAVGDTCSHEDYSLCDGDVWPDECEIECPKHGSVFDLRTGMPQTLPATTPVPVIELHVDGDDLLADVPAAWSEPVPPGGPDD